MKSVVLFHSFKILICTCNIQHKNSTTFTGGILFVNGICDKITSVRSVTYGNELTSVTLPNLHFP